MDLSILTEEELRIFLEYGLPLEFHRSLYIHNNKLAQKIKGFRPTRVPSSILVTTSMRLILKEENPYIIASLNDFYEDYKKNVNVDENEMIAAGYPTSIAHSLSITKAYNEKFLPIYFKLEGISEDEQKKIIDDTKTFKLIESVCNQKTEKIVNDRIETLMTSINKTNELTDDIKRSLKVGIDELTKKMACNQASLADVTTMINNIQNTYVLKEMLNSKIKDVETKTKTLISEAMENAKVDELKNLQSQINELQKNDENTKIDTITLNSITYDDYSLTDEYLRENIGDVIDDMFQNEKFDVFREYIIELIYAKKPIIVPARNSIMLCEVLSSVICGGNFHVLSVSNNSSDKELLEKIESLPTINGNKVVLIRNKFNISDCGHLLNYIETRPFYEKFIFEIPYDKEAYFIPIESLDTFNFFFGKTTTAKINYRYAYDFTNHLGKSITNSDYIKTLGSIGINLNNKAIMNENFYGLLAYSIIPFVAINSDIETEELTNKLLNPSIRKKCEAILND